MLPNRGQYKLKGAIAAKLDKRFRDALDNPEKLTDDQINSIIENAVKNYNKDDENLEPFNTLVIPSGNNQKSTKDLYYHKKYYYNLAWPQPAASDRDPIYGEEVDINEQYQGESRYVFGRFQYIDMYHDKTFYGRIDTHNRPIYPSEKFLKLVSGTNDVFLLDFVCDALNDMIDKIEKLKDIGKLTEKSIYYDFKISKGWEDMIADHHKTMEAIFQAFVSNFANYGSKAIKDFNDFKRLFVSFLGGYLKRYPISRSNLQLTYATSPRISGTIFEIDSQSFDADEIKYKKYILDENFIHIQRIANLYGFMVDKNAPWRFIADLESPQMKARMQEKGFRTLQEMFDNRFYQTHLFEANSLRKYFVSYYDSYVNSFPYYTDTKKCGTGSKSKLKYRKKRNNAEFSDEKLLELYLFIRAKEARKEWTQEEFDHATEEAIRVYEHYSLKDSLNHILDKTTVIYGDGANPGVRTKKEENYRIYSNHQSYMYRGTFTIKL